MKCRRGRPATASSSSSSATTTSGGWCRMRWTRNRAATHDEVGGALPMFALIGPGIHWLDGIATNWPGDATRSRYTICPEELLDHGQEAKDLGIHAGPAGQPGQAGRAG